MKFNRDFGHTKFLTLPAILVAGFTMLSTGCCFGMYFPFSPDPNVAKAPGDLITTIFPNLVGFGIGVYALVFALSKSIVSALQQQIIERKRNDPNHRGSILMINAEFAYPLLVLLIATGIGVMAKLYPCAESLTVLAWAMFWYATIMTIEVVYTLFMLGDVDLLEKLNDPQEEKPK